MSVLAALVNALEGDGGTSDVVLAVALYIAIAVIVLGYFAWGWRSRTLGMRALAITPAAPGGGAPSRRTAVARAGIALVNAVAVFTVASLLLGDTAPEGTTWVMVLVVGLTVLALTFASMLALAFTDRSLYDRALGITVERGPRARQPAYAATREHVEPGAGTGVAPRGATVGRIIASAAVAVAAFLVLGFVFLIFYAMATYAGECEYEEVECGQFQEFVASDAFGVAMLVLIAAAALVIAWRLVLTRRRG